MKTHSRTAVILGAVGLSMVLVGGGVALAQELTDDDNDLSPSSVEVDADTAEATALESTGGGTVTGRELDDDGTWEIEVRTEDGREQDVNVDATTGQVVSAEADDDGDDDRDDSANIDPNQPITQSDAEARAVAEVGSGEATNSHLERDDGRITWEVDVTTDSGRTEVAVDATTGAILELDTTD